MKIQNKFLTFFLIFLLILIAQIFVNALQQQSNIEKIQKVRISEFSKVFEEIIDLKVANIRLFSYDYSYWDETIHFIKTHDQQWAHINLDQGLLTYGSEYIYVYDNNHALLYEQYDRKKYSSIASLINLKNLDPEKPIFLNYFIVSNGNPIQLFIAPIQYSSDLNRTGKPHGYLVVGKVWTPEFVRDFEKITKQSFTLKPLKMIQTGNYDIIYPLKDEHEHALYALGINLTTTANDTLQEMLNSSLISIVLVSMLGLGLLAWFMYRMIVIPLRQISRAMELNNDAPLNFLADKKGEFAQIARLIKTFFAQKEDMRQMNDLLEHKIEERTQELEEINKTLDERVHTEIQKRHEQEGIMLQQSRLAGMGELIGNIAHQWRQPLNVLGLIIVNIEDAYNYGELTKEGLEKDVQKASEEIQKMSKTIDDFRNFFQPDKEKTAFNVLDVVNDSLALVKSTYTQDHIEVIVEIDPSLELFAYKNEFSQIIINLFENARDAIIERKITSGKIAIIALSSKDQVVLSVKDNGGGIADEILLRIFEPYFSTKEEGKGSGIGLYMSKTIIEEHHQGKLTAANDDNGAVFTVTFPMS